MNTKKSRKLLISSMEQDCEMLHKLLGNQSKDIDVWQALRNAILAYSWVYINDDIRCKFMKSLGDLLEPLTEEQIQRLKDKDK